MISKSRINKPRVLLLYITKVSGHRQAVLAIQNSLRQLDPSVEAPTVNGFGYAFPILEKIVHNSYMSMIRTMPSIWDSAYDNPKVIKRLQPPKNILYKASHEKIGKLLKRYKPDVVVGTQAFPCGLVSDYKKTYGIDLKVIGVLTDFAPHSFWINKGIDYYVVPSYDSKERFIKKGVAPDSIKVLGIPIRSKFALRLNREFIAKKLRMDSQDPTILIMGGGQGLGPIKKIVKALDKIDNRLQMIVIAGKNKKIISSLNRYIEKAKKKILVYEFSNNVDEIMELATIIITKPGGMTTAESLAKGLPMVIINPIPGQEMKNTDFLIKNNIAIRLDESSDIGEEIEILLNSPERLKVMSEAAYRHARPNSSFDIAKLILGDSTTDPIAKDDYELELKNYV